VLGTRHSKKRGLEKILRPLDTEGNCWTRENQGRDSKKPNTWETCNHMPNYLSMDGKRAGGSRRRGQLRFRKWKRVESNLATITGENMAGRAREY